ncbi:hypothetical protein [Caballeronia insecticola]|uniref:Acyl-CoA dehydrogenase n=1 Tax=Caballeronia insecticola TaxID=758793 RepID=R4WH99_9BURK|nr:hypothetical protein [Caballeronia insecticola]BAN23488.1 acyl-CoA dehydrogenase [Caballeronia insecticola]
MDLSFSPAADAHRAGVRSWLEATLPRALRDPVLHHKRLSFETMPGGVDHHVARFASLPAFSITEV